MNKLVWTCWWQGKKHMPPLVERCIESRELKKTHWELRIIDGVNYRKYVDLLNLKIKQITTAFRQIVETLKK